MALPNDTREAYERALYEGVESLALTSGTGDSASVSGASRLYGFSLTEDAGTPAPALVDIYDGSDATGEFLMSVALLASESIRDWFGPMGIRLDRGLFIDRVAGNTRGSIFFRR